MSTMIIFFVLGCILFVGCVAYSTWVFYPSHQEYAAYTGICFPRYHEPAALILSVWAFCMFLLLVLEFFWPALIFGTVAAALTVIITRCIINLKIAHLKERFCKKEASFFC